MFGPVSGFGAFVPPGTSPFAGTWRDPEEPNTSITITVTGNTIRAEANKEWSPATGTVLYDGTKITMNFMSAELSGLPNSDADRIEWDNGHVWQKENWIASILGNVPRTPEYSPPPLPPGLRWQPVHAGSLPVHSVIAGEEAGGRLLFIARAWLNGWQIGYSYGTDFCLVPLEDQEVRVDNFEILTAPTLPDGQCLRWKPHSIGNNNPGLIQAGLTREKKKVFIGRLGDKRNGSHCIGEVVNNKFHYARDGRGVSTGINYDMLVMTGVTDTKGKEVAIDGVTRGNVELRGSDQCKIELVNDQVVSGSVMMGYLRFKTQKKIDVQEVTLSFTGEEVHWVTTFCTDQQGYQRKKQATQVRGLEGCKLTLGNPKKGLAFGTHFFAFHLRVPGGIPLSNTNPNLNYILSASLKRGYAASLQAQRRITVLPGAPPAFPPPNHAWHPMWMLSDSQFEAQEKEYLEERMKARAKQKKEVLDRQAVEYNSVKPVIVEEVFENERWMVVAGWSKRALLPTDRPHWSDDRGKARNKEKVELPNADWRWQEDDWHVDKTGTEDKDGWWYACNWPTTGFMISSKEWYPKKHSTSFVRRRKWIRTRMNPKLTPEFEAAKARHQNELGELEHRLNHEADIDKNTSAQRWQQHSTDSSNVQGFLDAFMAAGHQWQSTGHANFPPGLQNIPMAPQPPTSYSPPPPTTYAPPPTNQMPPPIPPSGYTPPPVQHPPQPVAPQYSPYPTSPTSPGWGGVTPSAPPAPLGAPSAPPAPNSMYPQPPTQPPPGHY